MAVTHTCLARVSLGRNTPVNYIRPTNDFVFMSKDGFDYDPSSEIPTLINAFYNTVASGASNAVQHYLGGSVLYGGTNANHLKIYDITPLLVATPPPMGSPIYDGTFTTTGTPSSLPLPDECAVVCSYHADLTGIPEFSGRTRPASRRRGRVYIGPLDRVASMESTGNCLVNSAFQVDLGAAYKALSITGSTHWKGGVWSRVDHTVRPVVGGSIDSLFDIRNIRGDRRPKTVYVIP